MLGYRLFLEVTDQREDVEKVVREQVHSWLREKRLDADRLSESRVVPLGKGSEGLVLTRQERDGSRRVRFRTVDRPTAKDTWSTQVTVEVPARSADRPWVMIEVEGPKPADPPKLAQRMLDVLHGRHGTATFSAEPRLIGVEEIDELAATILDPERRTLLFVAGSEKGLDLGSWRGHVAKLLEKTVGVAVGYVLDPDATAELAERLGAHHRVSPWTVRTFRPAVELDQPLDARRHRVLSTTRIIEDHDKRIAVRLGRVASEVSRETPLPARARRVDRLFQKEINSLLVDLLDEPGTSPAVEPPLAAPKSLTPPAESTPDDSVVSALQAVQPPEAPAPMGRESTVPDDRVRLGPELVAAARSLVGEVDDDEQLVLRLLALAQQGRRAQESQPLVKRRLENYESTVEELEEETRDLKAKLEESELDHAVAQVDLAASERRVRYYRDELFRLGEVASAATEPESELLPDSYDDLIELFDTLDFVEFTGDAAITLELEKQDRAGAWPGKVWDVLCALEDYAHSIETGAFDGDVDAFLKDPPVGCRSYSANRHARDETGSLRSNQKYACERIFRVPVAVDSAGEVFMGAHFKVAQARQTSPRLHYYNDIRGTGRIYVGYVGPHLRSTMTN